MELPIPPDGGSSPHGGSEDRAERIFTCTRRSTGRRNRSASCGINSSLEALAWAEAQQLIGVEEIEDVTYLRLTRPDPEDDEEEPELE